MKVRIKMKALSTRVKKQSDFKRVYGPKKHGKHYPRLKPGQHIDGALA